MDVEELEEHAVGFCQYCEFEVIRKEVREEDYSLHDEHTR